LKNIQDNKNITSFIILRGLKTITHVYTLLLYYTRNVELSYYHAQKSFYFYIEFVQQITDDQHTFLNLNTKDACMFVYKKTIFEINGEVKKNIGNLSKACSIKMDRLNLYITIIHDMIEYYQDNIQFLLDNLKYLNCYNDGLLTNLIHFLNTVKRVDKNKDKNKDKYINLTNAFVKVHKKKVLDVDEFAKLIQTNASDDSIQEKVDTYSCVKLVEWFLC
jgi:hypothetical protein